jgi:hypothetical protein
MIAPMASEVDSGRFGQVRPEIPSEPHDEESPIMLSVPRFAMRACWCAD